MKSILAYAPALALAQAVVAQVPTTYYVHESLPEHTLFHPENLSDFESLPVLVWGNGACSADPVAGHGPFLEEVASWGILVIALGTPGNGGSTSNEQMTQAIDWASENAGQGEWANIDATKLAAAGMSCGGTQAYAQNQDPRVTAFGIFNSGTLDASQTDATLGAINVPIFFFLGGPTDIAYENGMRDYEAVNAGVPSWVGNFDVGHGGTYLDPDGGVFGTAGQSYFRWVLRGETEASAYFLDGGAEADGWQTDSKDLESI
ncbi:hypothetical protein ASPVEDRAFT_37466 [Aspergillus versicolor CBS 583.65]|uniref:Dienelactone hydrolase domain-containing protein n=1 Tax=Aspergillus versicolor CBS 583.65 TaxID=1036611 RepID=A0A1L9P961_ASPVE|nr:uncharacterized protein ASPVEDRAFT_37466 [Aspergillus versicolor CBS 583.65]OJI98025.1 hypothetical protein ASPVEDRAFT_37466 [Aspergillus versicolor CBS 583.65]